MRRPFAVFDIDGTLIRWQLYHVMVDRLASAGLLGPHAAGELEKMRMIWKRREHAESFKAYESALVSLYEQALQNISVEAFDKFVTEVIDEYKDQSYVYTRELAKKLKNDGYFLLVISGSHQELVEQVARYYGFDDWIGSHYERDGKSFSGKKHIASLDKKTALESLVAKHNLSYENSLAIGDSTSDIAMLEMVENPIAFNPDQKLLKTAKSNGWKIVVERKNVIYELGKHDGNYVLE